MPLSLMRLRKLINLTYFIKKKHYGFIVTTEINSFTAKYFKK